jgi:hypothetical protein
MWDMRNALTATAVPARPRVKCSRCKRKAAKLTLLDPICPDHVA